MMFTRYMGNVQLVESDGIDCVSRVATALAPPFILGLLFIPQSLGTYFDAISFVNPLLQPSRKRRDSQKWGGKERPPHPPFVKPNRPTLVKPFPLQQVVATLLWVEGGRDSTPNPHFTFSPVLSLSLALSAFQNDDLFRTL